MTYFKRKLLLSKKWKVINYAMMNERSQQTQLAMIQDATLPRQDIVIVR